MKHKLTENDFEFMDSLGIAINESPSKKSRFVLYFWFLAVVLFIVWASFTQIDELVRGTGEVVPSGKNQIVQNLEGGIVKKIYVRAGDRVKKGSILLKIENQKSLSQLNATQIKEMELMAKIERLKAESEGREFDKNISIAKKMPILVDNEYSLYKSRKVQFLARISALRDQKAQKEHQLSEIMQRIKDLKKSAKLIDEEVAMMEPMVKQGVKSKVTFMHLQREQGKIKEDLHSAELSVPRIKAAISETENKIKETKIDFRNKAKAELNEATAELLRVRESYRALGDQMNRTLVRSPINGIVQKLFVNTVGGVIKPGEDLVEIVPTNDILWLEVKIKPSDIAFIYPGQKAIVKVSAYDFAIYGGLEGEVVHISADTTKDKRENVFYTIHIRTKKNYLGSKEKPMKIIPGMTVTVDIMTGKKSLMDYILKPILRAKEYTFTER